MLEALSILKGLLNDVLLESYVEKEIIKAIIILEDTVKKESHGNI